jgi:hypothetical protein
VESPTGPGNDGVTHLLTTNVSSFFGRFLVVTVNGPIDARTCPRVESAVLTAITAGAAGVIIDLTGARLADSHLLCALSNDMHHSPIAVITTDREREKLLSAGLAHNIAVLPTVNAAMDHMLARWADPETPP